MNLAAPKGQGEWVCFPPPSQSANVIHQNRSQRECYPITLITIRNAIRQHLNLDSHPFVLTGHQPEWFHPGVWAKNFLAHGIARHCSGTSGNCVIDSDLPRSCSISLPILSSKGIPARRKIFSFQSIPEKDIPWESWILTDPSKPVDAFKKIAEISESWGYESLATQCLPILQTQETGLPMSRVISSCRQHFEYLWGAPNAEIFLSDLANTPAFTQILALLFNDLPNASRCYNAAITDYRTRRNIESVGRPIPPLSQIDGWLEAPVWISSKQNPARQRLLVRRDGTRLYWRSDSDHLSGVLPANDQKEMSEALNISILSGIRFRPRALLTSLAFRVFLADIFIHGLGGALYDEMTDYWIRHWLKIPAPISFIATMTMRIPLPSPTYPTKELANKKATWRTSQWHPEELVDFQNDPVWNHLVQEKHRLVAWDPVDHQGKRERFISLRRVNNALRGPIRGLREELLRILDQKRQWEFEEKMFLSREHPWPAHEARAMETCMINLANNANY